MGKIVTKRSIVKYSYFLYLTSFFPYLMNFSGELYLLVALLLNTNFLYLAYRVNIKDNKSSKKLFKFSIIYLFLIFITIVADNFINFYL